MSDLIEEKISVFDLFRNTARVFPNKVAISCDNHTLTYSELEIQVNKLAHCLLLSKLDTNKPVIILLERSIFCYITMLAIIKIGGTYVPIESDYPEERINLILEDVDYSLIITSNQQYERKNINIDNDKAFNINVEFSIYDNNHVPSDLHTPNTSPDKTCYIIYTSGSTGKPKGVEVTYQNIFHYINAAQKLYKITHKDIIYQGFSLAFDASLEEIWMAFANGAHLVVATNKALRAGLDLHLFLKENQVTVLSTVPSLLNNISEDVPSIRLLILGGEVCNSKIISKWRNKNRQIFNTYGPTETTVVATALECSGDNEITIGKPLHGYETLIIDENNNIINNIGELCIGGPSVAKGYVNRPELTKQKFISDPRGSNKIFYKTGDKAEITENGEIKFYGRIDDQVKIRGFRVELNEIEEIANKHPSVKQSIAVYDIDGDQQLTIYIVPEKKQKHDLCLLRVYFKENLPEYMIPNNIEIIHNLPLLPSGKVNKAKLPKPTIIKNSKYVAPTNKLEEIVAKIWGDIFNRESISVKADFFYELGGNSLLAAKAVSEMRNFQEFRKISMLDIYNNPNISDLTKKYENIQPEKRNDSTEVLKKPPIYIVSNWKHIICGVAQFFGCLLNYSLFAWQLIAIYTFYSLMNGICKNHAVIFLSTLVTGVVLFPILEALINIISKWLLVGKIKAGRHKLWGFYYFRWWLYTRIMQTHAISEMIIGTPLIRIYYRLLGAKIGKNCFIGTSKIYAPDLLTIGANTSVGTRTSLNGYSIEDGWLTIYPIHIGENCYIGSECLLGQNVIMQNNSYLEHMSLVSNFSVICENQFYSGSPCQNTTPDNEHIIKKIKPNTEKITTAKKIKFSVLHFIALSAITLLRLICFTPTMLLIYYGVFNNAYTWISVLAPMSAIICVPCYLALIIITKKFILKSINPGVYSIYSMTYLKQWTITKILISPEILLMGDSMFFPIFLRNLGAKIGKNVEIGDSNELYPDFIDLEDESFVASKALFAEPSVFKGYIKYDFAKIGTRGFIGNSSLLPNGGIIGKHSLLGCMSITPINNESAAEKTNWLGSPAFFLPKRENSDPFPDDLKFTPSRKLKLLRYFIEFLRITLPFCIFNISLFAVISSLLSLQNYGLSYLMIGLPLVMVGCSISMVTLFVAIKWALIGRLKPDMQPLWSPFIWKNDIIVYWFYVIVIPLYLNFTLGTPFANIYYRMVGAKIGKKVYNETYAVTETDLISIGDYVCINKDCILQTHLYEDRVFKMSCIKIESYCNLGSQSVILYDSIMHPNSSINPKSLIMKGETLPKNTCWEGIPAQYKSQKEQVE